MDFNIKENREPLIREFPKLQNDPHFIVNSPKTCIYNCIAFAMGIQDRWVDSISAPGHWWPPISECSMAKESLVKAFEYLGFEKTDDATFEQGFDKVVLFCDDKGNWTHAARIIAEGVEHSKFGQCWDAIHSGNGIFIGSSYGKEFAYMRRKISDREISQKLEGEIGSTQVAI